MTNIMRSVKAPECLNRIKSLKARMLLCRICALGEVTRKISYKYCKMQNRVHCPAVVLVLSSLFDETVKSCKSQHHLISGKIMQSNKAA